MLAFVDNIFYLTDTWQKNNRQVLHTFIHSKPYSTTACG